MKLQNIHKYFESWRGWKFCFFKWSTIFSGVKEFTYINTCHKLVIIGSVKSLSPVQCQAINWTNADLSSVPQQQTWMKSLTRKYFFFCFAENCMQNFVYFSLPEWVQGFGCLSQLADAHTCLWCGAWSPVEWDEFNIRHPYFVKLPTEYTTTGNILAMGSANERGVT